MHQKFSKLFLGDVNALHVTSLSLCCVPEIQELDSNMQYLVYENHSKFIKASETIREVGPPGSRPLFHLPLLSLLL